MPKLWYAISVEEDAYSTFVSTDRSKFTRILCIFFVANKCQTNDLAILTLDRPVNFTDLVSPVCLPNAGDKRSFVDQDPVVLGWGSLEEQTKPAPALMQVAVKVLSNEECQNKYRNQGPDDIQLSQICAASPGRDSCQASRFLKKIFSYSNFQTFY